VSYEHNLNNWTLHSLVSTCSYWPSWSTPFWRIWQYFFYSRL
jgi:hypothetical protein